jgi:uncharacterized membrane protein YhdT
MGKIDEVKEILNTLRVAFSITIGFIALVMGALVNNYRTGHIDIFFWLGLAALFFLTVLLIFIIHFIVKKTKEIKEL